MTPELSAKIRQWQLDALQGNLSGDQLREAVAAIRVANNAAPAEKTTRSRKATAAALPELDLAALLNTPM